MQYALAFMWHTELNFIFFSDKKYIYLSIYSIKHENVLLGALSYGYPMGMLWLSYGINN